MYAKLVDMAQMGRPPVEHPREKSVPIRLSADELATLKAAAEKAGQKVGPYIRDAALDKAKRKRHR